MTRSNAAIDLRNERTLQARRLQIAAGYVAFSQAYRFSPQLEHPASAAAPFSHQHPQEILISEHGLYDGPEYGSVRTKINVVSPGFNAVERSFAVE